MERVAIVGAGLIGRAWAITFARAGCSVRLYDPDPAAVPNALSYIASVVDDLATSDLLSGRSTAAVLDDIVGCDSLADAVAGVHWVQECGPEKIDIKRATFAELDRLAPPDAILATSSSALLPSAIFPQLQGKDRCVVAHPINPPYLVPAVELVPAPWTDPRVMERAADVLRSIGQVPLVMEKEIDGFIMNRLQGALLDEAFRLVEGGYASAADVDRGIADGLALRWSFIGPFETIDLNAPGGIADYVARYGPMYAQLAQSMAVPPDWARATAEGIEAERRAALPSHALTDRQRWRDRRLMALRAHKKTADTQFGS
ncbi:3-hydroxyacyl-CoA dehydrogenase [Aureimonas frigidaquae]|uniref:3-hydroxyacyl-CoA dehydrogenase NAD-binding protein n=1 Tax=Aureimonas frigidaquae TaxID=424757 RepID=A0A0P0Z3L1_9HYPH|nr:3-hydroxyacyl-CoA dehydrogenase [Aureimonas frigidaquae]BAT28582.1 3-hydroxyacyl-CoA dehydrogenase NAD-binding protein [Aureimonas frigidaquae]